MIKKFIPSNSDEYHQVRMVLVYVQLILQVLTIYLIIR
jgi:hypothetical protein